MSTRRRLPSLNALRVFEAASRSLSFTKAADELHVTQGAVSRQIKLLEEYLGFELFDRTPLGVELTEPGSKYAATLTRVFDEVLQATDELANSRTHTVLTIRGYTAFLVRWLTPLVPHFQVRHPNIEIRLVSASESVDFKRDRVDLGIRYGYGRWKDLESTLLFTDELFPVCSPAVLARGNVREPRDLINSRILVLNQRRNDWVDWLSQAGVSRPPQADDIDFDDLTIAYQCAIADFGFVMGQSQYVRDEMAQGRLVAPFSHVLRRPLGYYLVCPRENAQLAKIVAFRTWLDDTLANSGG